VENDYLSTVRFANFVHNMYGADFQEFS